MTILAGDIGGTKTLLQIAADPSHSEPLTVLYEQRFLSAEFSTFDELLEIFLAAAQQVNVAMPTLACLGVAGPVDVNAQGNTSAKVTNLPWVLDEQKISAKFSFEKFRLINDFQAVGYGLDALLENDFSVLQAGAELSDSTPQPRVLIGAGTGLGEGVLVWRDIAGAGYYEVLSSEGGHVNFSPTNPEQLEMLDFLLQQEQLTASPSRVSLEDVLSGRGLVNIYYYFANKYPEQVSDELTQSMLENDAAAMVSDAALSEKDPLATRALDLFIAIYGSQAGNLALTCLARGGVFIAGGIAPKIQSRMQSQLFLEAFQSKGPMTELMKKIPVTLVTNPQVGLKGALLVASRW